MPDETPPRSSPGLREYGSSGPAVVLLHGGPGAPGYLAPVAQELAASFRVLEPLQRGSGRDPLTVARHVADLRELLTSGDLPKRPALVGHSWGAMLALAFAAEHPGLAGSLVLVSCGTFDEVARRRLEANRERRVDDKLRSRIERLEREAPDEDERLARIGRILLPAYSHDLVDHGVDFTGCDAGAYRQTWNDMLRLQAAGVYPAAFSAIDLPVLMLHGAEDPHPGALIRASLEPLRPLSLARKSGTR
jgi:pimeloyl-ACP methyl ester carboxylesterase